MKNIRLNSDEELMHRIKNEDEVAFELIFYRYKGRLLDFLKKSLPDEEDAEGIVQEVFVKLWLHRKELDTSKSLNSFLYTIARNELYGNLRKLLTKRKYLEELYFSSKSSSNTTEKQIEYKELQQAVAKLIYRLPEKRREVFILSREEGLSYKEISKKLGISENTVDTQIRKALSFLRDGLRDKMSMLLLFFRKKHTA
ncbi:RNA polymerase sigma-70 factor [Sunxiuqinia sp. A32]|uniref:RNA polymerase sigma-70 factor n=1 Tax=Sunxiuqinia sp. A32 TaxID=3461496 RepID=UPI00404612FE